MPQTQSQIKGLDRYRREVRRIQDALGCHLRDAQRIRRDAQRRGLTVKQAIDDHGLSVVGVPASVAQEAPGAVVTIEASEVTSELLELVTAAAKLLQLAKHSPTRAKVVIDSVARLAEPVE